MKGRIVMMLIYLFFSIGLLTAQDATVQGIVVSSEDNEPVVGRRYWLSVPRWG
ncbi:hypothetical protein [Bacteroides uniformis]|uniref:hypothetical protein n=1 Tax=Bacteroides uniformis TaxID=820 RepID=UPI002166425F|nr:hypothetical protein [Bacteroides uniformis]MCS3297638.1 hypothetical protein [Bacteroides uniformis]